MNQSPPSSTAFEDSFAAFGDVEVVPLNRIEKVVAKTMARNAATIPHVTHHDDADMTTVEEARARLAADGRAISPLAFVVKAVVAALRAHPRLNSSLDAESGRLVLKNYFNIGVAMDTPHGLLVPVLRECDGKSVTEIATEISEVSARARDKGLPLSEMTGGNFSISSLGGIGGTGFTPIINSPDVAILGLCRTRIQPVWDGATFQPRKMMPLSLSYDHRVVNGVEAARFTRTVAAALAEDASGWAGI